MSSDLTLTFSGDSSSLLAALNDIKSSVNATTAQAKSSAGSIGVAFAAMSAAVASAIAAATATIGASFMAINAAASRETLTTQFIPLLGSLEAATERMAELAEFAAKTPYELNELAQSSRILQSLTQGALATGDGLRLIGDAAATAGQPITEVATHIGRLYAGLQSGRSAGESLQRLSSEMGVMTVETSNTLELMQKAGMKGAEVWAVAAADIGKTTGSMVNLSETWEGKVSTMKDAWNELLVKVGEPMMEALKPTLEEITKLLEANQGVMQDFGKVYAEQLTSIAKDLISLGKAFSDLIPVIVSVMEAFTEANEVMEYFRFGIISLGIKGYEALTESTNDATTAARKNIDTLKESTNVAEQKEEAIKRLTTAQIELRIEEQKLQEAREKAAEKLKELTIKDGAVREEARLKEIEDPEEEKKARLAMVNMGNMDELNRAITKLFGDSVSFGEADPESIKQYEKLLATRKAIEALDRESSRDREERALAAKAREEEYVATMAMLKAEIAGDDKRLASLKEQQRVTELTKRYTAANMENPEEKARAQAALERKRDNLNSKTDDAHQERTVITDSKAAVGGGGNSVIIGDTWLAESKTQGKTLIEIRDYLKAQKNTVNVSGNVDAVLS